MRVPLLMGLLALSLPRVGSAQASSSAASPPNPNGLHPRFFIGLGGSAGIYRSDNEFFKSGPSPEFTAGLRLRPRLALEISTSYAHRAETNEYVSEPTFYDQTTNTNIHAHVKTETARRIIGVPLLLRFSATRAPQARLHLDWLVGVTVAQINLQNNFAARNDAQVVFYSFGSNTQRIENYLDAGLSLRYSTGAHLELVLNALGQLSFTHPNPYGGNFCGSVSGGARYSFGKGPVATRP